MLSFINFDTTMMVKLLFLLCGHVGTFRMAYLFRLGLTVFTASSTFRYYVVNSSQTLVSHLVRPYEVRFSLNVNHCFHSLDRFHLICFISLNFVLIDFFLVNSPLPDRRRNKAKTRRRISDVVCYFLYGRHENVCLHLTSRPICSDKRYAVSSHCETLLETPKLDVEIHQLPLF